MMPPMILKADNAQRHIVSVGARRGDARAALQTVHAALTTFVVYAEHYHENFHLVCKNVPCDEFCDAIAAGRAAIEEARPLVEEIRHTAN